MNKTAILINVKDRPTELAMLLESLKYQTFQKFDVFILDDFSGTPLKSYHFLNCIINRLKQENHLIFSKRTEFPHGVSRARQRIVDWALKEGNYKYFLRVDDDVILESDYIKRLFVVLSKGYNLASGVTVPMSSPTFVRDPKFLNGIVNRVILNKEGNYIMNGDDCGMQYTDSVILPAHHFRSCALYYSNIHKKVNYLPTKLSVHGFREEQIFSYKLLMNGFKIGVDTGAITWHQLTPSGGERKTTNLTPFNQEILEEFTKEHKEELKRLFPDKPMPSKEELNKSTNLLLK
ncbi:MAG: glycosyltransferase family A protein [Promethearchaeota archaeon]